MSQVNTQPTSIDGFMRDTTDTRGEVWVGPMLTRGQTGIDKENRRVTAVVSTPAIARDGMVIAKDAFDASIPQFMRNPVMPANHQYVLDDGTPAVIGQWERLAKADDGLEGTCKFMTGDKLADDYWRRYEQGAMRAFSVRWITRDSQMQSLADAEGKPQNVRVLTRCDLLEISAVVVPSDPGAVVTSS